jgi:hypothetical protein
VPNTTDEWIALSALVTAGATVTLVWVTFRYAKAARDLVEVTSAAFLAERAPIIITHPDAPAQPKEDRYIFSIFYKKEGGTRAYNVRGAFDVHGQHLSTTEGFDLGPEKERPLRFVLNAEHIAAHGYDVSRGVQHAKWTDTFGNEYRIERHRRGTASLYRIIDGREVQLNLGPSVSSGWWDRARRSWRRP